MSDERNKASFRFDPSGAREQQQVKPRIAVVDEFFPQHDETLEDRKLETIKSRADVEDLLNKKAFSLSLEVSDELNASSEPGAPKATRQVELKIDSLDRFTPGGIVDQIKSSEGETNRDLREGHLMLEATKNLRAQLKAANRQNSQFVQGLVRRVVEERRKQTDVGTKLQQTGAPTAASRGSGFLEGLSIKNPHDEND